MFQQVLHHLDITSLDSNVQWSPLVFVLQIEIDLELGHHFEDFLTLSLIFVVDSDQSVQWRIPCDLIHNVWTDIVLQKDSDLV